MITQEALLAAARSVSHVDSLAKVVGLSGRGLRDACKRLGLPPPKDLLRRPSSAVTTTLVIPDCHIPFHDKLVWETILAVGRHLRPDIVVIIGDFADCYAISFHPKSPERKLNFKSEIEAASDELDRVEALGVPRVIFCEGNHENRLNRYLAQRAPELHGLLSVRDLLRVDERPGWEWVPYQSWVKVGKVAYSHEVGECGKYTAQRTLDAFGDNIVVGHSHRGGVAYGGTVEGSKHVALNVGWAGDAAAVDYMHAAKTRAWQAGFGLVEQDAEGVGWCSFTPILEGRCMVRGQVVEGRLP